METELESERVTTPHKHYNKDKTRSVAGYTDGYKPAARTEENMKSETPHWDEKLEALRAYRKSKGMCFTCEEKWNKTHKCPSQIPLHVMEELLEVLQSDEDDSKSSVSSEDDLMLLAPLEVSSAPRQRRSMRLHGMIGKQHVLILVDSGANASFINAELAQQLGRETKETLPARFVAANGAPLVSAKMLPQLQWFCQGHSFTQDLHILPLPCYDMILVADWLEDHSPMWVHWKRRWMKFTHQ
ncbi:uncharacterized protein LOC124653372 [Lolium rigidum]|uniref:uncharacterized protein LOC124653372 n=1 Tax=Lolium rigidum TaxID=89674 RepID=UPI001F5D7851|nr:uncharacterized protein LOC124653372 [Lolium rigidum]